MNEKIPKYIIVENRIKEAVRSGKMIDKIPGERVLAKEFGVSYMTLRKAVENLVAEDILYKIPARGTYVTQTGPIKAMVMNIGKFIEHRVM
jgi:DNA-binding GntR family transcriptional regulator